MTITKLNEGKLSVVYGVKYRQVKMGGLINYPKEALFVSYYFACI
jgi:hypothetical protein